MDFEPPSSAAPGGHALPGSVALAYYIGSKRRRRRAAAVTPVIDTAPIIAVQGGGDPTTGAILVATPAVWTGDQVETKLLWQRNGVPTGAVGLTYTTTAPDEGADITVVEQVIGGGDVAFSTSNAITVTAP